MIQRIALYIVLGLVLDAVGAGFNTWGFWCILALFISAEVIARREGLEYGMYITATLPIEALKEIQQLVKDIEDKENKD
jgi:hypothetical protein